MNIFYLGVVGACLAPDRDDTHKGRWRWSVLSTIAVRLTASDSFWTCSKLIVCGISPTFISGLGPLDLDIPVKLPSATDFLTIAEDLPGGRQEVSITCPDLLSGERFWGGLSQWLKEG